MNSPNCKQIQAELLDYHDQEMSVEQRKRVSEHLAQCHHCRQEYEGLRAMLKNAKKLPIEDPGEEFWQHLPHKVLAQVQQEQARMRSHANADPLNDGPVNDDPLSDGPPDTVSPKNVINLSAKRQSLLDSSPANATGQTHGASTHDGLKAHRLTAALAVAAGMLLVINIMMFSPKSASLWFDQSAFQAQIATSELPALVQQTVAQSTSFDESARLGFMDQQRAAQAFMVGSWLAETSAFLHAGQYELGLKHLQVLQSHLQQQPVSAVTLSSLRKAEEMLDAGMQAEKPKPNQFLSLLSGFQRDYENFLSHTAPQQIVLYRAGIWVFNANLAVQAKDAAAVVRLANATQLDYLQNAFLRLNAPPGVQNSLENIATIAHSLSGQRPSLSDRDYRSLQESLRNLQALLG
jgi:anti-sigma factor RsiW